ncbi:MAG TPA: PfkB family carbohydrate kinase, partial [Anaeromyxobacteraceae bacterium]|nr:PfkB family carbohydrate kinase [Anaeromyxobacteraceae bacterium]
MPIVALACGHVTLDRMEGRLAPGGSVYYAANAYRALGARARAFTAAGPDFPAAALAGIESLALPARETTRFVNAYLPGGRRVQRVEAAAPPLDPSGLPPAWREADVLHLAPVLGEVRPRDLVPLVRARVVGLSVQGLVRAVAADGEVRQPRWEAGPGDLEGVGAALLGEDDLVGQGDLVARLVRAVPVVVVTHGARGCEVFSGGRRQRVGVHATREVDPTGAGDVFAAGFLLGLARGMAPVEAARLGAGAASVIVEAPA